jgi:glycosyltransferase involved in cell wall biosynthesis
MCKVSVIIPNYNHALFLEQRIQSILSQTFRDFEIVILDDCSTDASKAVIEKYRSNPKVSHIVYNETNSGSTFKQWSKGIALAKGEYIWIAESDDWCEEKFLEELLKGIEHSNYHVIAFCQSYCIDETDRILRITRHDKLEESIPGKKFIEQKLLTGNTICNASMAIFKREYFNRASADLHNYRFAGDWLFWIRMCTYGNVFVSGKALNYYRTHSNNVSGKIYSSGKNFIEDLAVLKQVREEGIFDEKLLKSALSFKYRKFSAEKNWFTHDMAEEISKRFACFFSTDLSVKNRVRLYSKAFFK